MWAPRFRPVAVCLHGALVQFNNALHDVQAKPEAVGSIARLAVCLTEFFEDVEQQLGRKAATRVGHLDDGVATVSDQFN
jgi:hypothetical protein